MWVKCLFRHTRVKKRGGFKADHPPKCMVFDDDADGARLGPRARLPWRALASQKRRRWLAASFNAPKLRRYLPAAEGRRRRRQRGLRSAWLGASISRATGGPEKAAALAGAENDDPSRGGAFEPSFFAPAIFFFAKRRRRKADSTYKGRSLECFSFHCSRHSCFPLFNILPVPASLSPGNRGRTLTQGRGVQRGAFSDDTQHRGSHHRGFPYPSSPSREIIRQTEPLEIRRAVNSQQYGYSSYVLL